MKAGTSLKKEDRAAAAQFSEFLMDNNLSTTWHLDQFQEASTITWRSNPANPADAVEHTLDYIAFDVGLSDFVTDSQVLRDVDNGHVADDHSPICTTFEYSITSRFASRDPNRLSISRGQLRDPDARAPFAHELGKFSSPPWNMQLDLHDACVAHAFSHAAATASPKPKVLPRKPYASAELAAISKQRSDIKREIKMMGRVLASSQLVDPANA